MNAIPDRVRTILITAVLAAGAFSNSPGAAQSGQDTALLLDLEQRLTKAAVAGDSKTYGAMLAPDWSVVDAAGRELPKEQVMVQMFSPELKILSAVNDGVNVRTYGDTAIVTGRTMGTTTIRGARANSNVRFMDVFVRRNGQWLLVGSQRTPIVQ